MTTSRFGSLKARDSGHREVLDRIGRQTRERFRLPADAVVVASEVACALPGCPPIETVVLFWTADGTRHRFKVFKPADQVGEDDLPYVWLMRALAAPPGYEEDCC